MLWVFALSVFLLLHTYVFYALLLIVLDGFRQARSNLLYLSGRRERRTSSQPTNWPTVSVVIAAHNEAACIAQKLTNSLALDYPEDKFEVLVGSDGSTDGTDELVRARASERVRLSSAPRGGKVAVLNRCIPQARGEIVVLTDANTELDASSVRMLVRHFRDAEVGAVCGRLRLYNRSSQAFEESTYWTYESLLKFYEGKHGCVLGANGGIYALRRALFTPLPVDTIVDDFVIPLRILRWGYQVRYDPEAVALEETTGDYGQEAGRRARIAAGNFQSLREVGALLSPSYGFVAFALWSHKLLRWSAPALMALAMFSNLMLLTRSWAWLMLGLQMSFYAMALAGARSTFRGGLLARTASAAYYFTRMNGALAVGFWRFVRNSQAAAWQRTAR
jgi:cellulose synthase/poly-beta-1,6-N-acetylglucosamine synthase-like glycosyltransferase